MTSRDLEWAAGFLEGEGCFGIYSNKGQRARSRMPRISAVQIADETLMRLKTLFGGHVQLRSAQRPTSQNYYAWVIQGARAIGVMMTLYTLLSAKRKAKIKEISAEWKSTPLYYPTYTREMRKYNGV